MICFDSELFPQNLCDSSIVIRKALIYTMNALSKSSELWHTSVNRKARQVVEGEHDKSWNNHGRTTVFKWNTNQEDSWQGLAYWAISHPVFWQFSNVVAVAAARHITTYPPSLRKLPRPLFGIDDLIWIP